MPPSKTLRNNSPEPAAADASSLNRWDWAIILAFFAWTFTTLVFPLYDTDFWWHLKTGELILQGGAVPQIDWYTFTDHEKPWIDMHWGFQIFLTVLYRLGGANLVILAKATIITAAVGIGWFATGRGLPIWSRVVLWLLPVVAISGRGYERPEMLSQLFLATWLFVAFRVEEFPRLIWALPAVMLVWVNCHALFVLGLVVGAAYAADCIARDVAQGRWGLAKLPPDLSAKSIIWAGGLVVLACFCNPYFEEGVLFPLTLYRKFTVDQDFYSMNIGEFTRPIQFVYQHRWRGLANMYLLASLGTWLLTAGSFLWVWGTRWQVSVLRLILFAAYSHLGWEATRNANIFALVSGVILCANVQDALAAGVSREKLPTRRGWQLATLGGLAVLIVLVISGVWNRRPLGEGNKPFALGETEAWFIHGPAKFAGQPGMPQRAFVANNGQAEVYLYHNAPDRRVFMDARLEVCTRETFEVYLRILKSMAYGDTGWQELFAGSEGGLPAVILDSRGQSSREAIMGLLNTPGWRLVFADGSGGVFLDDATADRLNLPAVDFEPLKYPPGTQRDASRVP